MSRVGVSRASHLGFAWTKIDISLVGQEEVGEEKREKIGLRAAQSWLTGFVASWLCNWFAVRQLMLAVVVVAVAS